MKPRLAITMGDPAGVGPELCLRALKDPAVLDICTPVIFGSRALLARVAATRAWDLPGEASATVPGICDVDDLAADAVVPGTVSADCGAAAYGCVVAAIDAAVAGDVDGICTAPINKQALNAAGIAYAGHTEILADRTGADRYCMMLTSDAITCSLVTTHMGLRDVPEALTTQRVLDTIELTAAAMHRIRGSAPRLVVLGLNPHAGEGGLFGQREEERIIEPALSAAVAKGLQVVGPLPADTAFIDRRRAETDAFICMYHDQGLIPLKMLAFDSAVNVTLGLPIVRTSVDHGTAFDIAWQGRANPGSLVAAIQLAAKLATA